MGLILDTSVLVATERGRFRLEEFCLAHAEEEMFISAITASELLFGVERADTSERREARSRLVERHLQNLEVLDFDLEVARRHAALWAQLSLAGQLIGTHDLQMAATALRHGFALATLNDSEFGRVPGLQLTDVCPFAVPSRG